MLSPTTVIRYRAIAVNIPPPPLRRKIAIFKLIRGKIAFGENSFLGLGENSFFREKSEKIAIFPQSKPQFFFACGGPIYLVKSIFCDLKPIFFRACGGPILGEINFGRGKIAVSEIMWGKIAILEENSSFHKLNRGKIALFSSLRGDINCKCPVASHK